MISSYVCDLISLLVEGNLFTKEEMQSLLQMDDKAIEETLRGNPSKITLNNLECLTSILGIQCFDCNFPKHIYKTLVYRSSTHSDQYENIKKGIEKLQSYFNHNGAGINSNHIVSQLGKITENQEYVKECEFIVDALKDAGIYTEIAQSDLSEDNEEEITEVKA